MQKYAWSYEAPKEERDAVLTKSPALLKGSLVHVALAQHYIRMMASQQGTDPNAWCEPQEAVELIAGVEGGTQYINVVNQTYEAYARHFDRDEDEWKILGVEELGHTKIKGKYLLTGRRDLIIEDRGGKVYAADHKTSSRVTPKHKQYYTISGQLLGYDFMARQQYGDRYAGFIINLVEMGGKHFERIQLPRSPNMEAEYEQSIVDIEESIERLKAEGRPYDRWPKAMSELTCFHRYGPCEYIDQCRFGAGAAKAGNWSWEDAK